MMRSVGKYDVSSGLMTNNLYRTNIPNVQFVNNDDP